jgi:uncharacterized membrane protein YkoI
MKKLTAVLTGIFVIGGTAALVAATSGEEQGGTDSADASFMTGAETGSDDDQTDEGNEPGRISKKQAGDIALSILDGKIDEIELDREDGVLIYEVEVKYQGEDYDFDIDAETGEILKIDDDLLGTSAADLMTVTSGEAVEAVKALFPDAKVDDVELEMKKGRFLYEVEIEVQDEDGDVYVDGETGEIVHADSDLMPYTAANAANAANAEQQKSAENQVNEEPQGKSSESGNKISPNEAGNIALTHIGKGVIDDIELEKEKGRLLYEVEIEYGDTEADVYVDAYTGEVIYVDYD